jgi:hypothetical protein
LCGCECLRMRTSVARDLLVCCCPNGRYRATMVAWVGPSLKVLDNKIINVDMATKPLSEVDGVAARVNATDTVLDDAEGSERYVMLGVGCRTPAQQAIWRPSRLVWHFSLPVCACALGFGWEGGSR